MSPYQALTKIYYTFTSQSPQLQNPPNASCISYHSLYSKNNYEADFSFKTFTSEYLIVFLNTVNFLKINTLK